MFRNRIRSTPFTSEAANEYFFKIFGGEFDDDSSFLSSLRALLASRLGEDETLELVFGVSNIPSNSIDHYGPIETFRRTMRLPVGSYYDQAGKGFVYVHGVNSDPDANVKYFDILERNFTSWQSGWHRVQKVTDFFRKSFKVLCYIRPEFKQVALFVEKIELKKLHYIQCGIPAFLPWYFSPEAGVTTAEMNLITSLREATPDKYIEAIEVLAKPYDFRSLRIKSLLAGFETRYEREQCEDLRNQIREIERQIKELDRQLAGYYQSRNTNMATLMGLELKMNDVEANQDSPVMQFFLDNQKLVLESYDEKYLTFSCWDYLEYFDEDLAKTIIDNPRSYIYLPNGKACNNYIKAEDMKALMYAIFIDQTLRMRFCSAYQLNITGIADGLSNHEYGNEFKDCMPNTHINTYSCIGDHRRLINSRLRDHDYLGAIGQCIASCKSLNFGDSTVMCEFIRNIYGMSTRQVNTKCIELPDGRVVDPKGAIEWLKAQGV